jgi:hemolysin activation/secretion protein
VELSYPLIRSRSRNFYVNGGFDYVNSDSDFAGVELYEDRARVAFVGIEYDYFDATGAKTAMTATLRRGLDVLGASDEGDDLSRLEADPQATVIAFEAYRQQLLTGPHNLDIALAGQYAFDPLLSTEEFALGGERFGRGYDPAEIAGDHGLGLSLEYRHITVPRSDAIETIQAYGFYDVGRVWNKDSDADSRESLASAGAGIRARFSNNLFAEVELAKPLTRTPGTEDNKSPRLYVQVFANF